MKVGFFCILLFWAMFNSNAQTRQNLTAVIEEVSTQWRKDSNSCNGYRRTVADKFVKSKIVSITKSELFSKLGKPNHVDKFYSGITKKNYVGFVYYTYKDGCPKIELDGHAIQFVFDESETTLLEITDIEYCG